MSGRMTRLHMAWHWWWALIWASARWYSRAAWHLDRWFVLVASELELHVGHPNEERVGCHLVGGGAPSWATRR